MRKTGFIVAIIILILLVSAQGGWEVKQVMANELLRVEKITVMEQSLCEKCKMDYRLGFGNFPVPGHGWVHCHYDEPDPEKKEKCWCEYPMVRRSQWIGLECPEETRHWHIDNCPACGKRLVT